MFFFGEFPYSVDDRNRIPIPPPFRAAFDQGVVMTLGMEPCITIYTQEAFKAEVEGVRNLPTELDYVRQAKRAIFAHLHQPGKPDGQGRVPLDPKMMSGAGIVKDVVVVGADTWLEIWDRTAWEQGEEDREAAHRRALEQVGRWRSAQMGITQIGPGGTT